MSPMLLGIAGVTVLLAGLVLIAELRTVYDQRRLRERSDEGFDVSGDVHNASFMGLPVDTGHGCGGYGHGGGCDGGGGHGV